MATVDISDAMAEVAATTHMQSALGVVNTLLITSWIFPKQTVVTDEAKFDFIVVGGGSAGCVVASRLAESQYNVLLIEAGGDPPLESVTPGLLPYLQQTRYSWNYTSEYNSTLFQCHRTKTSSLPNGRMLGGGSSINFMFYVRGCPGDFDSWATAANDSSWDYNGVLPYFIKSENLQDPGILNSPNSSAYHGTKGYLGVSRISNATNNMFFESFKELGNDIILDINSNFHTGFNYPMFTISNGVRQSTAATILAKNKENEYLHVLKDTFVNRIILDEDNNAIGVEATTSDNNTITLFAEKEVIVSAGGINTPHLLMNSGIGPAEHLETLNITVRSDLPVGKNYQDHPALTIPIQLGESHEPVPVPDSRRFPFETISGYVALNKSSTCPNYQTFSFFIPNDSKTAMHLCVFDFGLSFEVCQKIFNGGVGKYTFYTTVILLRPDSRGEVLLNSTNPTGPPIVRGGYLTDDRDLEMYVDSVLDYIKILNTTNFKKVNAELIDLYSETECTDHEYLSRDWWRCYVRCMIVSVYHYSGTSAMGTVVDSHLRVLGINNLRVVDASVMPYIVSANTNAASIMIGEKGADFIKQDHSC